MVFHKAIITCVAFCMLGKLLNSLCSCISKRIIDKFLDVFIRVTCIICRNLFCCEISRVQNDVKADIMYSTKIVKLKCNFRFSVILFGTQRSPSPVYCICESSFLIHPDGGYHNSFVCPLVGDSPRRLNK